MSTEPVPHVTAQEAPPDPTADRKLAAVPDVPEDQVGVTAPRGVATATASLVDIMVALEVVTREVADEAIETGRQLGRTAEYVLLDKGTINQEQYSVAVAERHGVDHLDLSSYNVDLAAANLITPGAAKRYEAIPVQLVGERGLLLAMADPANVLAIDDIALMTGYDIKVAVASREDILALTARQSRLDMLADSAQIEVDAEEIYTPVEIVDLRESADDAPTIKLVNQILAQAADQGASDIHFEPEESGMRVRYRIDGVLIEAMTVPRKMVSGLTSRVKIIADLDIAERRVPQDGRVGLNLDGRHIDLRLVTLPSAHGESMVIRILDKSNVSFNLAKLGMSEENEARFKKAFNQAYGAVLVTGPTGSGKSTSLYTAVSELNTIEKNIITVEDPVEFQIPGITQVQTNNKAGLTFANGLRAMMRADPDIIMVGEIRDKETAKIAIEAALTGHLVLSTLHTNDAPTAVTRLVEMGIEPFLVASAVDCVVAQRLARTLCQNCKVEREVSKEILLDHGFKATEDIVAFDPGGCTRCGGSGYKGRVGMYEVMTVSDEIRNLAIERAPADRIAAVANRDGMRSLREDGFDKVLDGVTSVAEVARVTGTG